MKEWFKKWEASVLIGWVDKNEDGKIQDKPGQAVLLENGKLIHTVSEDGSGVTGSNGELLLSNKLADTENELHIDRDIMVLANLEIQIAYTKLTQWYNQVEVAVFKAFNTISRTMQLNYRSILNSILNRITNASAESFNAKVKAFRTQFRGVRNM